jgi:ABC-type transport system substrate-binding protein
MIALFQSSLTRSETIDSTPPTKVLPSRFYLLNDNTVATTINRVVQLDAASPVTALDGYTLTITLTEPQRVQALEISNTPGGDGTGKKEARLETDRKHD